MSDTVALDERIPLTSCATSPAAAPPAVAATLEASYLNTDAEAERCARHQFNLQRLRSYVVQAAGKTATQIGKAIDVVAQIPGDASVWEEFALEAEQVKVEVLRTLGQLKDAAAVTQTVAPAEPVAPAIPETEASIETSEHEAIEIAIPVMGATAAATTLACAPSLEMLGLLRAALELTEYTATPFEGRFPTHPKPSGDWWAGLRQRIEALQPPLHLALGLGLTQAT